MAALRVIGDDVVPQEISALLGAEPTHAQRKGDTVPTTSGGRIAAFGLWRLSAPDKEPEDLDGQVSWLLSQLTQDLEAWRFISRQFRIDLFCGWFMDGTNEGVSLSPATLLALGERGIELGVDLYAPSTLSDAGGSAGGENTD
jgi:hypothetical protein